MAQEGDKILRVAAGAIEAEFGDSSEEVVEYLPQLCLAEEVDI